MRRRDTIPFWSCCRVVFFTLACALVGTGQTLDWRPVGNTLVDWNLASLASGPVERVWYSPDGSKLMLQTGAGKIFETNDFETWQPASERPSAVESGGPALSLPEPAASLRRVGDRSSPLVYAIGGAVYRSSDEGRSWRNVSHFRGESLLGSGLNDLAVSPKDPDEITVATRNGVWRSLDGGQSWSGLNEGLPNLPARKILRIPGSGSPARILLDGEEAIWRAGSQRKAWNAVAPEQSRVEEALRQGISALLQETITAVAASGDQVYAGTRSGRIWASADQARTWQAFNVTDAGAIENFFLIPGEPRLALAAAGPKLLRTINGGLTWDEITSNLTGRSIHAVTADLASGAIYAGTGEGLFQTYTDLRSLGPPGAWRRVPGRLPNAAVLDVQLDDGGNQLYVLVEGYGVFSTLAPHRLRDPRIVNAADHSTRAAAPGSLLSFLGGRISAARSGNLAVPVLGESQVQVPFEVTGSTLPLAITSPDFRKEYLLPLQSVSPAIFIDRDGSPMILDAERGVLLDPATPARAGTRIQILATGLGRVTPDWPTGLPAPAENLPRVIAPVRVFLDRVPIDMTRAVLAPGYIGFYLVEAQLPDVVNAGPAELYIEALGQSSARVTLQLTQ